MAPAHGLTRAWQTVREYTRRIYKHGAEDDLFFLASGLAFSILLAVLPFVLLIVSALAFLPNMTADAGAASVHEVLHRLLPEHREGEAAPVHDLVDDVLRSRGALGIWSAVLYIWFSARLYGALRSALARVFDVETQRGIIAGKLFDFRMTVATSVLAIAYIVLNAYIAFATRSGAQFLRSLGIRDDVMGGLEHLFSRVLAFALVLGLFWGVYRFIPVKRIHTSSIVLGATAAGVLFELARALYTSVTLSSGPGSIYSGTLYTIVSVVFWVYYAAFILLIGAEVARVHELRRLASLPRTTLGG
ncbi:MAG TPA: YihY/virulence factor BrkB family protein [Gemmatimonadaceae bacterium]|nr:YihY/virulence factor BrkB family protein [Gemmatimonadaceae bacterium]